MRRFYRLFSYPISYDAAEECRTFWPNPRIAGWIKTIQSGGMPEFGPNLNY